MVSVSAVPMVRGVFEAHPFRRVQGGQEKVVDRCAQYNITKTSGLGYRVPLDTRDIEVINRR